jgi:hypothetical protein
MRKALVEIFDDDSRIVKYEIAVNECRDTAVRIQIEQILGQAAIIDVDYIDIDALLGQYEPSSMTPRIVGLREKCHHGSTVRNYRHAGNLLVVWQTEAGSIPG